LLKTLLATGTAVREHQAKVRREKPYLFVTATDELLFIENVAELLFCGEDKVRRIPRSELPAVRTGKRLQYLRADVLKYASAQRDHGGRISEEARGRRVVAAEPASAFDPIAELNAELPRGKRRGK
jgi:hypothetical protein